MSGAVTAPRTAPLDGILVVELASFVAAPAAGALLRDFGAEVIKLEVPWGEIYRHSRPRMAGIESDFPEAPHFQMDNRGKRSLALDLTREEARAALRRVIDRADVVITNMLLHRQEKFGLDAATLRRDRPELIFASLSGYGPVGEEAREPAFDYTAYWARTGFMDTMRDADSAPVFLRPGVGDHAAALSLVTGILAALRVRDATGAGQVVDVSLMHAGFYVLGNDTSLALATGESPPNHDRRRPRNPLWNHFETKDGRWIFLVMIESDRYWPRLCQALDLEDVVADARFESAVERYRNSEVLTSMLAAKLAERTYEEWRSHLSSYGLIWAPVQTLAEAINDPQARSAGIFQTVEHPTAGTFESVSPPLRLSGYDLTSNRPAPGLGADGEVVLAEAGLTPDEIAAALRAR